jgi:hypothetical protein
MLSCAFQDRYPKVSFPDGAVPSFSCPPRLGFPDDDVLTVRDHDLPKVTAALEVAVCLLRFREQECLVDYGVQSVHLYGAVHGLEVGAASDADRAKRNPRPVSNKGSRPVSDGVRLAPIRLTCPPTAKACSDIAIVPGPPISTMQSTPRPSVSSRTFWSQSDVTV